MHFKLEFKHYGWLQNEPFVDYKVVEELGRKSVLGKRIDRLIAEKRLPEHTYQICHPNVLRFKTGEYTENANELIKALADQISR